MDAQRVAVGAERGRRRRPSPASKMRAAAPRASEVELRPHGSEIDEALRSRRVEEGPLAERQNGIALAPPTHPEHLLSVRGHSATRAYVARRQCASAIRVCTSHGGRRRTAGGQHGAHDGRGEPREEHRGLGRARARGGRRGVQRRGDRGAAGARHHARALRALVLLVLGDRPRRRRRGRGHVQGDVGVGLRDVHVRAARGDRDVQDARRRGRVRDHHRRLVRLDQPAGRVRAIRRAQFPARAILAQFMFRPPPLSLCPAGCRPRCATRTC